MTNAIRTLTDPAGVCCSSELPWEAYALLVAAARRNAPPMGEEECGKPDDCLTPADVAATALERAILRRIDDSEGMQASLLDDALRLLDVVRANTAIGAELEVDIGQLFARAVAAGVAPPGTEQPEREAWPRWRVRGVVAYGLSGVLLDARAVIDTTVTAPDWHAAETVAFDEVRAALGLSAGAWFAYTWAAGPAVTPCS